MVKSELRKTLLQRRRSLSVAEWQARSDRLVQHLQAVPLFAQASTVLAYFSIRQEPDLSGLWHHRKIWGFPRCVGQSLVWHQWQRSQPLATGPYGIPEPAASLPVLEAADVILVPAVACDRHGYRLGYGGGFYDRLLSHPAWAATPTIGITFAFAHVDCLPHDPWDQPLTAICTELGYANAAP
jgi:5-formyltetrahydrofolate cyclo-ligase